MHFTNRQFRVRATTRGTYTLPSPHGVQVSYRITVIWRLDSPNLSLVLSYTDLSIDLSSHVYSLTDPPLTHVFNLLTPPQYGRLFYGGDQLLAQVKQRDLKLFKSVCSQYSYTKSSKSFPSVDGLQKPLPLPKWHLPVVHQCTSSSL